jgi:hypothetical protein
MCVHVCSCVFMCVCVCLLNRMELVVGKACDVCVFMCACVYVCVCLGKDGACCGEGLR